MNESELEKIVAEYKWLWPKNPENPILLEHELGAVIKKLVAEVRRQRDKRIEERARLRYLAPFWRDHFADPRNAWDNTPLGNFHRDKARAEIEKEDEE